MNIEIAHTMKDARQVSLDMAVSKQILEILHRKYPGYPWGVKVIDGMAFIKNMATSGEDGYAVKYDATEFSVSNFERQLMLIGGEMLEMFGLSRRHAIEQQFLDMKFDLFGKVLPV